MITIDASVGVKKSGSLQWEEDDNQAAADNIIHSL